MAKVMTLADAAQLLGLAPDEHNPAVIDEAVSRKSEIIKKNQADHPEEATLTLHLIQEAGRKLTRSQLTVPSQSYGLKSPYYTPPTPALSKLPFNPVQAHGLKSPTYTPPAPRAPIQQPVQAHGLKSPTYTPPAPSLPPLSLNVPTPYSAAPPVWTPSQPQQPSPSPLPSPSVPGQRQRSQQQVQQPPSSSLWQTIADSLFGQPGQGSAHNREQSEFKDAVKEFREAIRETRQMLQLMGGGQAGAPGGGFRKPPGAMPIPRDAVDPDRQRQRKIGRAHV